MDFKKIKYKIKENIEIKIISIALAVILWFYAIGQQKTEITFNIPLEIDLKENMIAYDQSVEFITISLRGQQNFINGLSKSQIRIIANLQEYQTGIIGYDLTLKNVTGTKDLEIIDMLPKRFTAKLDYKTSKYVPIKVATDGQLPSGYFIEKFIIEPDTVMIEGAGAKVKKTKYIKTSPINLSGAKVDFSNIIRLSNISTDVIIKSSQEIKITARIVKEKTLSIPLEISNNFLFKANIFPVALQFSVTGDIYTIDSLKEKNIKAIINAQGLKKGEYIINSKNINLVLPDKVKLKKFITHEVKLVLQ